MIMIPSQPREGYYHYYVTQAETTYPFGPRCPHCCNTGVHSHAFPELWKRGQTASVVPPSSQHPGMSIFEVHSFVKNPFPCLFYFLWLLRCVAVTSHREELFSQQCCQHSYKRISYSVNLIGYARTLWQQ